MFMHRMALLEAENKILRATNNTLSRRRRAKKQRLRDSGAMSVADGQDQMAQIEADLQIKQETQQRSSRRLGRKRSLGAVERAEMPDTTQELVR